jgi:hypothetical protein
MPFPINTEDLVFALLQRAAEAGHRCPTNPQIAAHLSQGEFQISATSVPKIMGKLARQGQIVVRVYGKNWRDVTICTGPHSEKTTMAPPHGGKPHTVITATGRTKTLQSGESRLTSRHSRWSIPRIFTKG